MSPAYPFARSALQCCRSRRPQRATFAIREVAIISSVHVRLSLATLKCYPKQGLAQAMNYLMEVPRDNGMIPKRLGRVAIMSSIGGLRPTCLCWMLRWWCHVFENGLCWMLHRLAGESRVGEANVRKRLGASGGALREACARPKRFTFDAAA